MQKFGIEEYMDSWTCSSSGKSVKMGSGCPWVPWPQESCVSEITVFLVLPRSADTLGKKFSQKLNME